MPRRRHNYSSGGGRKKVPRVEPTSRTAKKSDLKDDNKKGSKKDALSQAPAPHRTSIQTKVQIKEEQIDERTASPPVPFLQVLVKEEFSNEVTGSPPEDSTSHSTMNHLEDFEDNSSDICMASPSTMVSVSLEVKEDGEVTIVNQEKESHDVCSMKMEEVDCGVETLAAETDAVAHSSYKTVAEVYSVKIERGDVLTIERSLNDGLPPDWFCKSTECGFNVMLLSRCTEKAIQRRIFFYFRGSIEISAHRQLLSSHDVDTILEGLRPFVPFIPNQCHEFMDHVMKVVQRVWSLEICGGADQFEYEEFWVFEKGVVDMNPYGEIRYKKTFRSEHCKLLVNSQRWRCKDCMQLSTALRKRKIEKYGDSIIKKADEIVKPPTNVAGVFKSEMNEAKSETVYILNAGKYSQKLALAVASDNTFTLKEGDVPNLPPSSPPPLVPCASVTNSLISKPYALSPPVPNVKTLKELVKSKPQSVLLPVPTLKDLVKTKPSSMPSLEAPVCSQSISLLTGGGVSNLHTSLHHESHIKKGADFGQDLCSTGEKTYSVISDAKYQDELLSDTGPKTYGRKEGIAQQVRSVLKTNYQQGPVATEIKPVIVEKIKAEIETTGIPIGEELAKDFMAVLNPSELSSILQTFLALQPELASVKKTYGIRWHPILIRLAILSSSTSNGATRGVITLPSGRELFNFSQVLFNIAMFQKADISELCKKYLLKPTDSFKGYHVLLLDEIDVRDNLVFQRSNGELVGFVKLSEVPSEVEQLELFIGASKHPVSKPKCYSVLLFIVKRIFFGMHEVVGLIDAENLTKETLWTKSWDMIGALEDKGVKILAVVSNGSLIIKEFMGLHAPVTKLGSGQVYSVVNHKAHDRLLYFFIDASYLLKEIRNSFESSGFPGTGHPKFLTKTKEAIVWKTLVKLYLAQKFHVKLNAQNVFLNEYSRMKPSYASAVMSETVAKELIGRCWPSTTETVTLITNVHDFFSCLYSVEIAEGKKQTDPFPPYTSAEDPRFTKMLGFLDYLGSWRKEVNEVLDITDSERSKLMLDENLCNDLEVTVRAFIDASLFLWKEGVKEINPNSFWLEPLGKFLAGGWFGFKPSDGNCYEKPIV